MPFPVVPENVSRVLSVQRHSGAIVLRVQFAVCGFAKRPGGRVTLNVVGSRAYAFHRGQLVATSGIRRGGHIVPVIRSLRKSEEHDLDCPK